MKTNKWKLSLLVWSAMFPFSTAINYGLTQLPFTAHWPLALRTGCLTCMIVPYMVFGAFPFLHRHFGKWMQHTPPETPVQSTSLPGVPPDQTSLRNETSPVAYRTTRAVLRQTGLASE